LKERGEMMKKTIMEAMKETVGKYSSKTAFSIKVNNVWESTTWKDYYDQVQVTGRAFMALGLEKGDAVSIIGSNCPQWLISDYGAIFAGAVPGGIYTTNSPEQCHFIAEHSEASIAVVENEEQLAKFMAIRDNLPKLKAIVMMYGSDADEKVYSWEDLPGLAKKVPQAELQERMDAQSPDDLCTLIYTSGTTGNPKGVMLSHDNITWTAKQLADNAGAAQNDIAVSYLPLSHIAEQIISLHCPASVGFEVYFAESIDTLGDNLVEVRPTIFLGVPRVWEKIQAKMMTAGAQSPPLKKKIAAWARKKGLEGGYADQKGEPKPFLYGLANKLVFSKVREKLGLDRCRLQVSAAAPISMDTLEFFLSLGIPITEVYGMSENTGPGTISTPDNYKTGSAGPAMIGTEVKIADDGEILMRGRHVFKGYFKNEEETKKTIDSDGWLHSGDIGEIDSKGFLKITDRKKELIITAGGENIAPQLLEGKIKAIPVVSQATVIGDRRKYLTALITLDPEKVADEAASIGSSARNAAEAAKCDKFVKHLQGLVDEVNKTLARVQMIKKFTITPEEFSIEGGELTPTMKLKRRIIYDKYSDDIERMYA
jgi:long-subunit acyl-CoA synthetase (AMP-forming)